MFSKKRICSIFFLVFFGLSMVQAAPAEDKKPVHSMMLFGQLMYHKSYFLNEEYENALYNREDDVFMDTVIAISFLNHIGVGYSYMYPISNNLLIGGDIGVGLNIFKIMLDYPAFIFPINLKAFIGSERFGIQFNGGVSAYTELDLLIPYDTRLYQRDQVGWNTAFFGHVGGSIKLTDLGFGIEYHFAFDEDKNVHGETSFLVFKSYIIITQ